MDDSDRAYELFGELLEKKGTAEAEEEEARKVRAMCEEMRVGSDSYREMVLDEVRRNREGVIGLRGRVRRVVDSNEGRRRRRRRRRRRTGSSEAAVVAGGVRPEEM